MAPSHLYQFLEQGKSWAVNLGPAWPQESLWMVGNCRQTYHAEGNSLAWTFYYVNRVHELCSHTFIKAVKTKAVVEMPDFSLGGKRRQCTHLCAEAKWFNSALGPRYWDLQRASDSDCWRRDVELNLLHEKRKCPEAIWDLWFYLISLHLAQI